MTIVSIRGTHGSGKSSVVTKIMAKYGAEPVLQQFSGKRARPSGYVVQLPTGQLFVVGPYETACGGCDAIQPYERIWPLIETAAKNGSHVLFEGALVSSSYGSIGRSSEAYGDDMVFAFLDTPKEECVARVNMRRAARGKPPLEDAKNIIHKFDSVARSYDNISGKFHRRCVWLNHQQPVREVLKLFGVTIRKEPQ